MDTGEEASSSSRSPAAESFRCEEEEALVALVNVRSKEVDRLRGQIRRYESQLEVAVKRLEDTQSKLSRLRSIAAPSSFVPLLPPPQSKPKDRQVLSQNPPATEPPQSHSKPPLIIPAVRPLPPPPPTPSDSRIAIPVRAPAPAKAKRSALDVPSPERDKPVKMAKGKSISSEEIAPPSSLNRSADPEHIDLISIVGKSPSATPISIQSGTLISSQHKRKIRCLEVNDLDPHLFATSALNGVINLWKLHPTEASATLICSADCLSLHQRWPEDISWHPNGHLLLSAYTADDGDSQISLLSLNSPQEGARFLREKPHKKGIINKIRFLPSDVCFITAGSDHAVFLWKENGGGDGWKARRLHGDLHSSAVMAATGLRQKNLILSAGVDKRVISFDFSVNRVDFKHQMDSKCLDVLPNPADFNLIMVQTGSPGKQLRLFDARMRWNKELHWMGWKQESSESQSALVNQYWSTDGLYLTSGSADPRIHLFDIRAGSHGPARSMPAHQKRVFKAAWHPVRPMLISISSDLNIGLHTVR